MNQSKIAALYASPIFNTLLRFPTFDTSTTLTEQVMAHVVRELREVSEDGRRYELSAAYPYRRERNFDDCGHEMRGFLAEKTTKRVADWMLGQMPGEPGAEIAHLRKEMPEHDIVLVQVWGYGHRDEHDAAKDIETLACLRYGAQEDFEILLRGMASIRRKRRKQAKKLEAQLRAYHAQQLAAAAAQELAKLRRGIWLGAEKALTTAARIDEPGIPFMGDTSLTHEQRVEMGMRFYAVSERIHGMPAAFPVGTGMALLPVNRSRQLVDGAVYFWRWKVGGEYVAQLLGRLDMSAKERGHLPIRDEEGDLPAYCWAAYGDSAAEKGIEIYRVTHYTTRNAEPIAKEATTPLHQPQLRGRRVRRELQAA